ncbi:transmembrane protein, putative [Bodo saltans]|uniref:Transmembrane protein, putative n=1 Tax=Bodo saltans TaxID=75058 RepID=A0A0S4J0W3_BODSA|nr:transmembrane protein, putative [Bodo saltans]|eukprot:CUG78132.1 transmembrane protein, putative [Bodo saltans]
MISVQRARFTGMQSQIFKMRFPDYFLHFFYKPSNARQVFDSANLVSFATAINAVNSLPCVNLRWGFGQSRAETSHAVQFKNHEGCTSLHVDNLRLVIKEVSRWASPTDSNTTTTVDASIPFFNSVIFLFLGLEFIISNPTIVWKWLINKSISVSRLHAFDVTDRNARIDVPNVFLSDESCCNAANQSWRVDGKCMVAPLSGGATRLLQLLQITQQENLTMGSVNAAWFTGLQVHPCILASNAQAGANGNDFVSIVCRGLSKPLLLDGDVAARFDNCPDRNPLEEVLPSAVDAYWETNSNRWVPLVHSGYMSLLNQRNDPFDTSHPHISSSSQTACSSSSTAKFTFQIAVFAFKQCSAPVEEYRRDKHHPKRNVVRQALDAVARTSSIVVFTEIDGGPLRDMQETLERAYGFDHHAVEMRNTETGVTHSSRGNNVVAWDKAMFRRICVNDPTDLKLSRWTFPGVVLEHRETGEIEYVVGVHLTPRREHRALLKQLLNVDKHCLPDNVKDRIAAIIFAGDFNFQYDSFTKALMADNRFLRSFEKQGKYGKRLALGAFAVSRDGGPLTCEGNSVWVNSWGTGKLGRKHSALKRSTDHPHPWYANVTVQH